MTNHLNTSVEHGVGILQLDHPEKRNALGWELHHALIEALDGWAHDEEVAAVLLIGNEEYFCSGWALDVLEGATAQDRTDAAGDRAAPARRGGAGARAAGGSGPAWPRRAQTVRSAS